jgi:hypothetical protein
MRRFIGLLALIWVLVITPYVGASAQVAPYCQPDQAPQFRLGLAHLKAQVGLDMGDPIECEHADAQSGDVLQQTTTGLAIHFSTSDMPTFTTGHDHWALTPDGVAHWTGWHTGMAPPGTVIRTAEADSELPPPAAPLASLEAVTVVEVSDPAHGTLVISHQGSLYQLETSAECLGTLPTIGEVMFTRSAGAFAEAGSDVILSVGQPACSVLGIHRL